MAQLVKHTTLDFGSGHDHMVHGFEPCIRLCAESTDPAWNSLSPLSLPLPYLLSFRLSKSMNRYLKKKKRILALGSDRTGVLPLFINEVRGKLLILLRHSLLLCYNRDN